LSKYHRKEEKLNHIRLIVSLEKAVVMVWIWFCVGVLSCTNIIIIKHLSITHTPVTNQIHKYRSKEKFILYSLLQLLIILRWLLVIVCQEQPLYKIHVDYSKKGHWKQNRHNHSIHEANVNLCHDAWVVEMHFIFRTGI
jgi:hypothetical protein